MSISLIYSQSSKLIKKYKIPKATPQVQAV